MQEQKARKATGLVARLGLRNIIWLTLFGVFMLAVVLIWLLPYRTLPTATGRIAHDTLPWKNANICVESVQGFWESAEGNERLMLRTAYYPVAEITLGDMQGNGMLYLHFTDERGRRAGDNISLSYENGQFTPRESSTIKTEGKTARIFVETGFLQKSAFELHCRDINSPLWRIHLRHLPEGSQDIETLGSVTIPAKLRS